MADIEDEKTTVNVKGVLVDAWERAKISATKRKEPMGAWLSRAANLLADQEAAPANNLVKLEPETVKLAPRPTLEAVIRPEPLTASDLAGLIQAQAARMAAGGTAPPKKAQARQDRLVDDLVRVSMGMPPNPVPKVGVKRGKAAGQPLALEGKADAS